MIHSVLENISVSLPEKDYMDESTVTPTPQHSATPLYIYMVCNFMAELLCFLNGFALQ